MKKTRTFVFFTAFLSLLIGDLAFVRATPVRERPWITEVAPLGESLRDPQIRVVIVDMDARVVPASIRLFLDGVELKPLMVTDTPSGAEAAYQVKTFLPLASRHTNTVVYGSDDPTLGTVTNVWIFTVGPIKSGSNTLFIEAEDFNYSNDGITGGLHSSFADTNCSLLGKDAILGVDYFEVNDGNDPNAVPAYRAPTGVEAAKPGTGGFVRGDRTVNCNYIVGWNDVGDWYNYTRDFGPLARYNVYARLSSGSNAENAELARINSATTNSNQTREILGTFSSPPTGNWDVFHHVPLRNAAGNLVSMRLGGLNTLRFTVLPGSLDFDYLAFVKADPPILLLRREGANAMLEWPVGLLQSAPALTGPWSAMPDAVSPYPIPTTEFRVFRLIDP